MRRAHTVTFKTEYKGHIISGHSIDGGQLRFQCDLLREMKKSHAGGEPFEVTKTYDSVDAILDAIDRYDLSLRKEFTNTKAYRIGGGWRADKHTIQEVTVTSVTEDGREAWIKVDKADKHAWGNGREKVMMHSLYNSKEACKHYVDSMNFLTKQFEKDTEKAKEILDNPKNMWTPKTEA